jgi:ABC-type maltose transport system permease subunit
VEAVKLVMRYFSYLFHLLLVLFLIGVSGLALASGAPSLNLGMLPWTGSTLSYVLFFGALAGLVTVLLAIRGTLRVLFLIWSLLVFVLLIKGYVFSGYKFNGDFKTAIYLIIGSVIALAGAWFQFRGAPRPRKY